MNKAEVKLNRLSEELEELVEKHYEKVLYARNYMDLINLSKQKYREASDMLAQHAYAGSFISLTNDRILESKDVAVAEDTLRTHSRRLHEITKSDANDSLSEMRRQLADLFDDLLHRYFED